MTYNPTAQKIKLPNNQEIENLVFDLLKILNLPTENVVEVTEKIKELVKLITF